MLFSKLHCEEGFFHFFSYRIGGADTCPVILSGRNWTCTVVEVLRFSLKALSLPGFSQKVIDGSNGDVVTPRFLAPFAKGEGRGLFQGFGMRF